MVTITAGSNDAKAKSQRAPRRLGQLMHWLQPGIVDGLHTQLRGAISAARLHVNVLVQMGCIYTVGQAESQAVRAARIVNPRRPQKRVPGNLRYQAERGS